MRIAEELNADANKWILETVRKLEANRQDTKLPQDIELVAGIAVVATSHLHAHMSMLAQEVNLDFDDVLEALREVVNEGTLFLETDEYE